MSRTFGLQQVLVISQISGQLLIELDDETVGSRVVDMKEREMLAAQVTEADQAALAARKAR